MSKHMAEMLGNIDCCFYHTKRKIDEGIPTDWFERLDSKVFFDPYMCCSDFSEYSPFYVVTNECIKQYLEKFDVSGCENALSVLGSGDQVLNIINSGIKEVDTFDLNKLTEFYFFGLKVPWILKYDYDTFLNIMDSIMRRKFSLDEELQLISDTIPYMDLIYRRYWKRVVDYASKSTTLNSLFSILSYPDKVDLPYVNSYLASKEDYDNFKHSLAMTNIHFECYDAKNLGIRSREKYDLILLSNILDYFSKYFKHGWKYEQLVEYENQLINILGDNGVALMHYIYYYMPEKPSEHPIFFQSDVYINEITGKNEEIVPFVARRINGTEEQKCAILALRKNL